MGRYLDIAKGVGTSAGPRLMEPLKEVAPATKATKGQIGTGADDVPDPFDPPSAGHAPEWRRWFSLLAQHKEDLGHSPDFAARLAYGEALTAWHLQNVVRSNSSCCAGCGAPVADPVHVLPDGAKVHPDDNCLISYGRRWRAAAAAALAAMNISAPEGWQP